MMTMSTSTTMTTMTIISRKIDNCIRHSRIPEICYPLNFLFSGGKKIVYLANYRIRSSDTANMGKREITWTKNVGKIANDYAAVDVR